MTRPHPFDVAFGVTADDWFSQIRSEAVAVQAEASDLAQFARLSPVERILAELQPDQPTAATADAGDEYLRLLYAAYHFWNGGRRTVTLARDRAEHALALLPRSADEPVLMGGAYYQFPERWFWAQPGPGAPHEPLDGLYVVAGGHHRREWLVLAVLGLREERGGFTQISATASSGDLLSAGAAARQPAFAPLMEGGAVAGFKSIASVAELLLAARVALASAR
ncbi:MAG: hypothetical protein HY700_06545 [Gemmatimonadetes bacterium]|nr:hypothetical protein [Gemmatimonadota bacterium]